MTAYNVGLTSNSYSTFSYVSSTTGAEYEGDGAKDASGALLLKAAKPSGLICSASAGFVKTISISFDSQTADGSILDIYVSNTPYTGIEASNLFDSTTAGTNISSLTYTAGTATITATSNANTSLSASCVVTVTAAAVQNYHLVTALDQLVTGAKVIIASSATDGSAKVLGPQSGT